MVIFFLTEQHAHLCRHSGESISILISLAVCWYSDIFLNNTDHKQVILLYERYNPRHRMTTSNLNLFLLQQSTAEKSHLMKCPFRKGHYHTKCAMYSAWGIVWLVTLSNPKLVHQLVRMSCGQMFKKKKKKKREWGGGSPSLCSHVVSIGKLFDQS